MRTAIFGGTFDPIHSAHLVVAHEAAEAFALDRVLFIPAANPPHKEAGAPYEDRFRMVELACAADPRFHASRLEAGTGPARQSESAGSLHDDAEPGSVVPANSIEAGTGPARPSESAGNSRDDAEPGSVVPANSIEAGTGPARPSESAGNSRDDAEPGSVVPANSIEAGREKSYSILTIERLRAPGARTGPSGSVVRASSREETLFFIIGADAFAEIRSWYRWEDVVASVEFIVVTRPGHAYVSPPGARVCRLETIALPVSSSEIRQELSQGVTPADLPPAVSGYIYSHGLYRSPQD